jgi:hypothetical protein
LLQFRVIDAEVMRHLVDDGLTNLAANRLRPAGPDLFDDRLPEQRDAVWCCQVVAAGTI